MSLSEVIVGVLITMMGIAGLIMLPRVWRGYFSQPAPRFRGRDRTQGELAYIWWPFGDATRRGVIRGQVPVSFAVWGIVFGYWIALLPGRPSHLSPATKAVAWGAIGWSVGWCVLFLTVMFFNWPKFVVPPSERGEPGAIAEWRQGSRRDRQKARTRRRY
jgi:hypothetical protein